MTFHVPEASRVRFGPMASDITDGCNGLFEILGPFARWLKVIASDGEGWEHVSVSMATRTPAWEEMHYIKTIFWDAEDAVMQLHPKQSAYVNNHPHCLHLWRPVGVEMPLPPAMLVGVPGMTMTQKGSP